MTDSCNMTPRTNKNAANYEKSPRLDSALIHSKSFNWLRREARGATYISYSELSNHAACAFDFGSDGYTASCNYGGELLQATAPSITHGIAFARGDFEYSLYSSLARGQRSVGGKSTFGLKLASRRTTCENEKAAVKINGQDVDSSRAATVVKGSRKLNDESGDSDSFLVLGSMIERGCFNYRWPFNEYTLQPDTKKITNTSYTGCTPTHLRTDSNASTVFLDNRSKETRTCALFSFVKDKTVYQVLRLEQDCQINTTDCNDNGNDSTILLTLGGPVKFQLFNSNETPAYGIHEVPDVAAQEMAKKGHLRISAGSKSLQLEVKLYQLRNDNTEDYDEVPLFPGEQARSGISKPGTPKACTYQARLKFPQSTRAVVFVAAFHLCHSAEQGDFPKPPKSEDIYKYVGIARNSERATGVMWESIFLGREEKTNATSELSEVKLIARCLEKILHVDLVPETFGQKVDRVCPLTVISNIFFQANIDLKALFWKVRFLVKVHDFLANLKTLGQNRSKGDQPQSPDEDSPEQEGIEIQLRFKDMLRIADLQAKLIKRHIKRIISYLVEALLKPDSLAVLTPDNFLGGDLSYYYVMITIWYVVNRFPDGQWISKPEMNNWKKKSGPLFEDTRLPRDSWPFEKQIREKIALLKWYHYGSMLKLIQRGLIPKTCYERGLRALGQKVQRLRTAAKMALAVRVSSKHPYSGESEIVDRLAFLATELGLEDLDQHGSTPGATIAALVVRRIKQRDFTRFINPGLLPFGEEGDTGGPWEIHALSHHSRLMVANLEEYNADDPTTREQWTEEIEKFRSKFCEFLTSEATLVPCWERINHTARRGWLRSEATAVLATTLLDICQKDMGIAPTLQGIKGGKKNRKGEENPQDETAGNAPDVLGDLVRTMSNGSLFGRVYEVAKPGLISNQPNQDTKYKGITHAGSRFSSPLSVESLLVMQLEALERLTGSSGAPPPIQWTKFRPPFRYHPEDFFNSLDDTPELYERPEIDCVRLPVAILDTISPLNKIGELGYHQNLLASRRKKHYIPPNICIEDIRDPEILDLVSVVDIKARAHKSGLRTVQSIQACQYVVEVAGRLYNAPKIDDLSSPDEYEEDTNSNEQRQRLKFDEDGKDRLVIALADSLVDQEVQHRVISAEKLPPKLLKLFVYIFHPEAVDGLSTHTLKISRFSCHQRRDSWVSRISLRSWSLVRKIITSDDPRKGSILAGQYHPKEDYLHSSDDDPIFLPPTLTEPLKTVNKSLSKREEIEPHQVMLKMSSIIISTNGFGDFSKCSIVTDLISDCKLRKLAEILQDLWHKFIHQPQTARCLVFLLILGLLCQEMARRYEDAVNYFVRLLNLGSTFINDEGKWIEDENSIGQVKLGLWGLESLYKLRNTLAGSIRSIGNAKSELIIQINEGPGKRSEQLEKMCQEYLEEFERNLGELAAINVKLERKVELNSRYRDALSALLALRDSRNSINQSAISHDQNANALRLNQISIEQNKTIEKLTYLTIGYLPIGLAATIFAVPDTQNVVFDNMGTRWFIGCIIILFVLTFAMVWKLSTILERVRRFEKWAKERWDARPKLSNVSNV